MHADIRTLFTSATLADLAGAVGGEATSSSSAESHRSGFDCHHAGDAPARELSEVEIERIVASVEGGAANVQDIYPLAPLQEGILFHHLLATGGDPYLLQAAYRFDSRARVDTFVAALQAVIDRHDVLRTAVAWEGLQEPVQVVWRHAQLASRKSSLDPQAGDAAAQLAQLVHPRRYRLDLRRAPLFRVALAHDALTSGWVMVLLFHHLISDHTTLEAVFGEIESHLLGLGGQLPAALPFRNFVAQARFGIRREEHEAFFREMLERCRRTDGTVGARRCPRRRVRHRASPAHSRSVAVEPFARAGACARRERCERLSRGVGTRAVGHVGPGRRRVRHGLVRANARRAGRRPRARPVHEHVAGALERG